MIRYSAHTPDPRGFSDILLGAHGGRLRYAKDTDRFYMYDGTTWNECGQQNVELLAVIGKIRDKMRRDLGDLPPDSQDAQVVSGLIKMTGSALGVNSITRFMKADPSLWVTTDDFARAPHLLNFRNGTLDLSLPVHGTSPDGEEIPDFNFREHRPDDMLTTVIPLDYDPFSLPHTPLWDGMLSYMCGDDRELALSLEQALAYGLYGANTAQMMVFLVGAPGIGKTQVLEIMTELAGSLGGHGKIELIMRTQGSEHDSLRSDLRGRRFIMLGEAGSRLRLDDLKMKDLTGSRFIPTRKLGQEQVTTRVTWTLYVATNELPEIHGSMDDAIARRLWLFPLAGKEIPAAERDASLPQRIIREEGPLIMQRLARHLSGWYADGKPVERHVQSVRALDKYRAESDTVQQFCRALITDDPDGHVTYDALHEAYVNFCRKRGLPQESRRKLPRRVAEIMMAERDSSNCRIKKVRVNHEAPAWMS